MKPTIAVDITARDKTSAGSKAAEKGFAALAKKTESTAGKSGFARLENQAQGLAKIAKDGFGLSRAGAGFDEIGRASLRAGSGFASAGEKLVGFASALQKVNTTSAGHDAEATALSLARIIGPAGMVAGGIAALGFASYGAGMKFADMGAEVGRTSQTLGMSVADLQGARAAAEGFGVAAATTDGALEALGDTLHNAMFGRDYRAVGALSAMGLQLKTTKEGAVDTTAMLYDLADAIAKFKDPQTQKVVAGAFGLTGMLPAIRQGSAALKAEVAKYQKTGAAFTDPEVSQSALVYQANTRAKQSLGGLGHEAGMTAERLAGGMIDAAQNIIDGVHQRQNQLPDIPKIPPHLFSDLTKEAQHLAIEGFDFATSAAKRFGSAAERVVDRLEHMGWSRPQALGIAGNLQRESRFGASRLGDYNPKTGKAEAYGIAQWHPDRQAAFRKWAGHDIRGSSLDEQVGFLDYELTHGREKRAGDRLRKSTSPADAAAIVSEYYERPAHTEAEKNIRAHIAELLASKLNGSDSPVPSAAAGGQVEVHVRFHNLPAAAKATVKASGVKANLTRSMEGAG